jgi:hypothetical protein
MTAASKAYEHVSEDEFWVRKRRGGERIQDFGHVLWQVDGVAAAGVTIT